MLDTVCNILDTMPSIGLEQMEQVRLMNRVDRKYVVGGRQFVPLMEMLQHDYMAQQVDGMKYLEYNTVYLDDSAHTMYLAHHNGRLTRQKVRVRTYMDSVQPSFFEIKLKNNHGRTKKQRIRVGGLDTMTEDGAADFLREKALLPIPLEKMIPTVGNRFERITLVNKEKTERITIDFGLAFHNFETGRDESLGNLVILEAKRNGLVYSPVTEILRELRIHPSGFSKYCIGSVLTNGELKSNRFNAKIRKINKLRDSND